MGVHKPEFGKMQARLATVGYSCDLFSETPTVLPLGAFAEIRFGEWYGLGLTARSTMSEADLNLLAPLAREVLSDPFALLRDEFSRVYDAANPEAEFTKMCERHSGSLVTRLASAFDIDEVPLAVRKGDDEETVKAFLKHKLGALSGDCYWSLVRDQGSVTVDFEDVRAA